MVVCFKFGGTVHCFPIPIIEIPIHFPKPGPGPVNYPPFIFDAIVVASLKSLAAKIQDSAVREAAHSGFSAAAAAMQKHIGPEVTIREE